MTPEGLRRLACSAAVASLVTIGILWAASRKDSGAVGWNGIRPSSFVGELKGGDELCQGLGFATRQPKLVQMTLGLGGARPQPLRLRFEGSASEPVDGASRNGLNNLALPKTSEGKDAVLCVKNRGVEPVSIAGEALPGALINGSEVPFTVSFTLLAERREWSKKASAVFDRIGYARGEYSAVHVGLLGLSLVGALVFTLWATWRFVG